MAPVFDPTGGTELRLNCNVRWTCGGEAGLESTQHLLIRTCQGIRVDVILTMAHVVTKAKGAADYLADDLRLLGLDESRSRSQKTKNKRGVHVAMFKKSEYE